MKKNGFTLVEVIVVLVILAVLAAMLIPSMTGWIDKAREKEMITSCRSCVMAAQTLITEEYGVTGSAVVPAFNEVVKLAEVDGTVDSIKVGKDIYTLKR